MAEAVATPENAAPAVPKKSKRKLFAGIGVLVLALGGGGAWFLLSDKPLDKEAEELAKEVENAKAELAQVFLPLDAFVVNLQPAGSEQYLQTEITVRLADQEMADLAKKRMPDIRNRVLMLLSTRTAQALITPHGKAAVADAIRLEIASVIDPKGALAIKKELASQVDPEDLEPGAASAADQESTEASAKDENAEPSEQDDKPDENGELEDEFTTTDTEESLPKPRVLAVLFTSFIIQ
ncbi:MAG: flagellar basal body-associated FliL family protein [Burkholderiales bacterium]